MSWNTMLKMSDSKLDLVSGIDMYQFIKKRMKGGISYVVKRYSKANNEYMKSYDKNESSRRIIYLDANNLYGWSMSYLPTGRFNT